MARLSSSPRDRLLDAADELFYERGICSTGVAEIVERAGVAKATLYSQFGSKDELLAEYVRRRSRGFRERVEHALAHTSGTPQERIRLVVEMLADITTEPWFAGCPVIKTAAEVSNPGHPARMAGSEHRGWLRALFHELAEQAGAPEPAATAGRLALLYDAIMVGAHLEPDGDAAQRAQETARLLIDNL